MTPERWQQINGLLDAVLDLPPGEQQAYIDVHCPDPELRREVLSLLAAHDEARSFLEKPAKEYASPLIPMANDLPSDQRVGQEIDGYRILDVLGRGGMGVVYKALDVNLDKVVALKMIDPALARDEAFLRRFRAEARALARIDSPRIVRVHAMRQSEGALYIVMEYVDGGTLTDLLRDGPLPWRRAMPIIRQMLKALEHAHSVNIVHRDIKPSNIMLTAKGVVKVTDFGLAKVRQAGGMTTVTQGIAGTLFYMSPEQVEGSPDLNHRSDLYSMGMTIYQVLTGRLPLDKDAGDFAIMRAIVEKALPPPSTFKPDLPEPVGEVVMKALEKDPDRRYQSAAEMREAFEALVEDAAEAETIVDTLPPYRRERPVPRRVLWIGGGVLGVAVLVLAAFLLRPSTPDPPRLSVQTNPDGALVYLGGDSLRRTPFEDLALDGAMEQAVLRIVKTGYVPVETTLVAVAGASVSLNVRLEQLDAALPAVARLEISSTPGNALVQVNGDAMGRTDGSGRLAAVEVDSGQVLVELFKDGHRLWRKTYQVEAGETRSIVATLEREGNGPPPVETATLVLQAVPGGSVSVAGEACQLGVPCTVRAGEKRITFRYQGHQCTRTLRLAADARQPLTCYFERVLPVQVREAGKEDPPWATIMVDGVQVGQVSDLEVKRGPGTYTISVERQFGYEVITPPQTITVEPAFEEKLPPLVFQIKEQ